MLSFELFLMIENHIRSFFSREERNLSLGKCIEWTRAVAVTCYSCHALNAFLTSRYQKRQKWACYLAPHSLETSNGPHPCHFDTFTKVINDGLTAKRKLKMKTRYLIQLMPQLIMIYFLCLLYSPFVVVLTVAACLCLPKIITRVILVEISFLSEDFVVVVLFIIWTYYCLSLWITTGVEEEGNMMRKRNHLKHKKVLNMNFHKYVEAHCWEFFFSPLYL